MAAKKKKSKCKNVNEDTSAAPNLSVKGEDLIHVSPSRIRYQHSRIRPHFSGCGRSVMNTLEEVRQGKLEIDALPPIQVLTGPDENDGLGPWYFSLNNRRLWVIKQCHREGLLDNERYNNKISVRIRLPKSKVEAERYTVANCALEAKFMREGAPKKKKVHGNGKDNETKQTASSDDTDSDKKEVSNEVVSKEISDKFSNMNTGREEEDDDDESDSESSDDDNIAHDNPFNFADDSDSESSDDD